MSGLNRTHLHDRHVAMGARMVEFAGWDMPVQYEGVVAESLAVRKAAGMFDVSHMARFHFKGAAAIEYLEETTANDVSKLADYGSQYSLMCYDDGGCVDDIILYRIRADWFRMVVNATNHQKDAQWLRDHLRPGVDFIDETMQTAMVAVQGPRAVETVNSLADQDVSQMVKFTAAEFSLAGAQVLGARTGYTGEDGFELITEGEQASAVWDALAKEGVAPCGLAARDVCRLEAGLALYGHELTKEINPIEAGLGWVISKTKQFIGSGPVNEMRAAGPPRKLVGVRMKSKIVPREGYPVLRDGQQVGEVSSGVYSPTLECGIAFAFLRAEKAEIGAPCQVVVRDRPHDAEIVKKRFLAAP
jgi:aminomethyltransferase